MLSSGVIASRSNLRFTATAAAGSTDGEHREHRGDRGDSKDTLYTMTQWKTQRLFGSKKREPIDIYRHCQERLLRQKAEDEARESDSRNLAVKLLEHECHYEARDAMIVVSKWKGFVHTEIWERIWKNHEESYFALELRLRAKLAINA